MPFCWSRCIIICQRATDEELRCPLRSHGATLDIRSVNSSLRSHGATLDIRSVNSSFLQNTSEFLALDALPTNLSLPLDITSVDLLVDKEAS